MNFYKVVTKYPWLFILYKLFKTFHPRRVRPLKPLFETFKVCMALIALALSMYITWTNGWVNMYLYIISPWLVAEAYGLVDLKLFFLFIDIISPYSFILLTLAHIAFLVIMKNTLVSNLIDFLTGNFIGQFGKKAVARLMSLLLPKSYFDGLSKAYNSYAKFLNSFRI